MLSAVTPVVRFALLSTTIRRATAWSPGPVQDLVLVGRLELDVGVAGFDRDALHAHRDQLLLRALGFLDVGAS